MYNFTFLGLMIVYFLKYFMNKHHPNKKHLGDKNMIDSTWVMLTVFDQTIVVEPRWVT